MEPQPEQPKKSYNSVWIYLIIIISFLGLLDSGFLTYRHYVEGVLPCATGTSCETVLTSRYSTVFNLPVSLFGVLYYLTIFVSALIASERKFDGGISVLFYLSALAFLVSLGFVYIQLEILKSVCVYCMASAAFTALILIFSAVLKKK